jgi:hypothetical protein
MNSLKHLVLVIHGLFLSRDAVTWQSLPPLNQDRNGADGTILNDTIYMSSGVGNRNGRPRLDSTERLNSYSLKFLQ